MNVLKDQVLVEPDTVKQSSLIVEKPIEQRGKVVVHGSIEEFENSSNISVIFGEDFDSLELTLNGENKRLLLMPKTNIKIFFKD
jgi:hypothetical protein